MCPVKAFIIHLERAVTRSRQVAALSAALPIASEIVCAVDAWALTAAEIANVYQPRLSQPFYPFTLSRNEVACFLSHRRAWAMMVEQNCDFGLFLEDDAAIGHDFADAFALAREFMTPHSFIRFPHHQRERGQALMIRDGIKIIQPVPVGLGQVAYLLSREAAQQLLSVTEIFDRPVDVLLQMFWLTKVRPLTIHPSGIEEISAQIGGSTLHHKRNRGEKVRREILRPLYRWRIARASKKYSERM